jgi:hypothetical protein
MFIDLGQGVAMSDEEFYKEMAKRRETAKAKGQDVIPGCPLCMIAPAAPPTATNQGSNQ